MTQSRKTRPLTLELADLEIDAIVPQRRDGAGLEEFANGSSGTEMAASLCATSCCSCCLACCCCCW
jgi:hypothetical protein